EELPVLAHGEISESQHQPRHGERQHRQEVENLAAAHLGPHDDVGEGDAEEEIDDGGEAGVLEAVGNGRDGEVVAESYAEILQVEIPRKHGGIPVVGEGHEHNAEVRQDGDEG